MTLSNHTHGQWDIFLSHACEPDGGLAKQLRDQLKNKGLSVYLHQHEARLGTQFPAALTEALENSKYTVVLLSDELLESVSPQQFGIQHPWLLSEINWSIEDGKRSGRSRLIPVYRAPTRPRTLEIPLILGPFESIFVSSDQDDSGWREAAEEIANLIYPASSVQDHARHQGSVIISGIVEGRAVLGRRILEDLAKKTNETFRALGRMGHSLEWLDLRGGVFLGLVTTTSPGAVGNLLCDACLTSLVAHKRFQDLLSSGNSNRRIPHVTMSIDWENHFNKLDMDGKPITLAPGLVRGPALLGLSTRPYVLLSDEARREMTDLFGGNGSDLSQVRERLLQRARQHDKLLEELRDSQRVELDVRKFREKHKANLKAYLLYLTAQNGNLGDKSDFQDQVLIEYRDERHDLANNVFVRRLVSYDTVCIIGLTHEHLVEYLSHALKCREKLRAGFWKRMSIVFPTLETLRLYRDQYNQHHETHEVADEKRRQNWIKGRKLVDSFVAHNDKDGFRSELLEYNGALSVTGQRFENNLQGHDNAIRFAPILQGRDVQKNFYIEVFNGQSTFDSLDTSIDNLLRASRRIVEWNIIGQLLETEDSDSVFTVEGIVRDRKRSSSVLAVNSYFLVVLILLHGDQHYGEGPSVILQRRTGQNANDNYLLSNISGWVTDKDLIAAGNFEWTTNPEGDFREPNKAAPSETYFRKNYGCLEKMLPDNPTASHNLFRELQKHCTPDERLLLNKEKAKDEKEKNKDRLEAVTVRAAVRELNEELGLKVSGDELKSFAAEPILLSGNDSTPNLCFKLFHLELTAEDFSTVREFRPTADLRYYPLKELERLYDLSKKERKSRFNRLLQTYFRKPKEAKKQEQSFYEIYRRLLNPESRGAG